METNVSVILPTYNERDNVGQVINGIVQCVPSLKEIIVVDDNSPDMTWAVVEEMANRDNRIKLIKRINERGLTSAIWTGIINANGKCVVWLDCDMGMPPGFIPNLVEELDNYDIAIGSRYVHGGKDIRAHFRRITSRLLNSFARLVLGIDIRDLTTGFVACRREVFNKIRLQGNYGEYCIRFLYEAKKLGYRIKEIPYIFKDRTRGQSKSETSFFRFGVGYVKMVSSLYFSGRKI